MGKAEIIEGKKKIEDFVKKLAKQRAFVFNIETEEQFPSALKILGASFCFEEGKAFYVPGFKSEILDFKPIFENQKIEKYGYDLKRNFQVLRQEKINLAQGNFDITIAAYLLNPGSKNYKLEELFAAKFGEKLISPEELVGEGRKKMGFDQVEIEKISLYSSERAEATWRLVEVLKEDLKENELLKLFQEIEMPLLPVLAGMEIDGVKIDVEFLKKYSKHAEKDLEKISEKIFKLTKIKFNLDSPIQLREILFEKLKISPAGLRRGKTGISTEAGELAKIKDKHPVINLILEYRELAKLLSTYLLALPKLVDPLTGRIHANFNQTITATGRLSSSNPNLQNIPVRGEMGKMIRKAFIAPRGFKILAADYSHIDLRVVASLADDKNMVKAFRAGTDIHCETASQIWNIPREKVTPELRQAAKTINFGVTYGMGARALALGAGIKIEEAKEFIEKYFTVYEGVGNFLEETRQKAHDLGFVETLFGRRRYLPEIYSPVPQIAAEAERMAINMPVQGTAADIMKLAMIKIAAGLSKISPESKMILQVHDELVFEIPSRDVKKVAAFVQEAMAGAAKLKVPLASQIEIGDNWGEMEKYKT